MEKLLESTWSDQVANDPRHRPQNLDRPSTTVRREWCRRPQEAHLGEQDRYRRLSVSEIAVIQGFDPAWVEIDGLRENDKIAALGNAVPPPVAKAIGEVIKNQYSFTNETLIEICAGIGGLGSGFSYLNPIAKIEMWDLACDILRTNKPWSPECIFNEKVEEFDFSAHYRKIGLLCGGPPCQPWSQAGRREGATDPRDVMGSVPEILSECEPEVFVIENVPGLISNKEHSVYVNDLFSRMKSPKKDLRYGLAHFYLNAADFGVPQIRRRVFVIGLRGKSNTFANSIAQLILDSSTHHHPEKPAIGEKPWVTLRKAFSGLKVNEPWRKWNIKEPANQGSDQGIKDAPILNMENPEVLLSENSISSPIREEFSRINLSWPNKDKSLKFSEGQWRFESLSEKKCRRSLLCTESFGSGEGSGGMVAVGDYVESLESLAPFLRGSGQMVYFDSPRRDILQNQSGLGLVDSTWLSIVRDVASTASKCLDHNGFFVLQAEEASSHYGRMVLDEVFGHENHVTTFAWQKKYGPQSDRNTPTDAFDYIIVYSKCHRDDLQKIGLWSPPKNIIDDGDWRGCFTAGHKGAKSGNERTKFKVNMPPYRWELLDCQLPEGRNWFDPITGVLWFERIEEVGSFWIKVRVKDAEGYTAEEKIKFKVKKKKQASERMILPDRVWWLMKDDNDIAEGNTLQVIRDDIPSGLKGEPFSLILSASGGNIFKGGSDSPGTGRYWEFGPETLVKSIASASAWFGVKGTALPSQKTYHDRNDTKKLKAVINWLPWTEYGKSEDATRHLKELAEQGIGSKEVSATSKPEPLLYHLIQLFAPSAGDIVISLGDPNASMAAVALKSGRFAVHHVGPTEEDLERWEITAKPRLCAVLDKKDTGGLNDKSIAPDFTQAETGSIHVHVVSNSMITYDTLGTVVRLIHDRSESISDFYAGCVGCSRTEKDLKVFYGPFGHAAFVLDSEEVLDHVMIGQIARNYIDSSRVYIITERSEIQEGGNLPQNIHILHAPFELVGKVVA